MNALPRRLAPVVALATGVGFGAFAQAPVAHASTDVASVTFLSTGAEQVFAVPLGVTSVHVDAVGGHGAGSYFLDSWNGGAGATVSADLDVSGGQSLYVEVGGNGTQATYDNTTNAATVGVGGFNGGGDANGTTQDAGLHLVTAPLLSAPTATTAAANRIGQHVALLHGVVNPRGSATGYWFQFGTTTRYGSTTPPQVAGSGVTNQAVTAWATGLRRHTTYHVRLVAVDAEGTTYGADRTFRTN